ncbi:MAG: hypothetical protein H6912_00720 [Kordiimonadaceae bacterium]|nr:hypothetical protein [Kordiimonadaceae bacterium]
MNRLLIIFLMVTGVLATPVTAHRQRAALTKILFNERTGNIEVMHRFYLHDTEHAVKILFDKNADIRNSADTQELFANYVDWRFAIKPLNGPELKLKSVGFEIERIYFWVYQEVKAPENIKGLTIIDNALRDIWTDQINTVNVEGRGDIRTATFSGDVEALSVEFDNGK